MHIGLFTSITEVENIKRLYGIFVLYVREFSAWMLFPFTLFCFFSFPALMYRMNGCFGCLIIITILKLFSTSWSITVSYLWSTSPRRWYRTTRRRSCCCTLQSSPLTRCFPASPAPSTSMAATPSSNDRHLQHMRNSCTSLKTEYSDNNNNIALESHGPINRDALQFLSELGKRLVEITRVDRACSFLFQRISVVVQRFHSVLLHDGFIDDDRPE